MMQNFLAALEGRPLNGTVTDKELQELRLDTAAGSTASS